MTLHAHIQNEGKGVHKNKVMEHIVSTSVKKIIDPIHTCFPIIL
jgi:hypothetical protein